MSGQPKPTASLSSTLLARKGQAKPAMRPQGFGGFGTIPGAQDDLGWNDMGYGEALAESAPVPPVLVQREVLREEFAAPADPEPEPAEPAPRAVDLKPVSLATALRIGRETRRKHSPKGQGRSAFTLRLDQDRHLRLRLASALHNASAQILVTEALDRFLQSLPEVDALVHQLPAKAPAKPDPLEGETR